MSKKQLNALFSAVDTAVSSDVKTVTVGAVIIDVTPLTMKMFTEFALETVKDSEDETEEVKNANAHGAMIRMLAGRMVKITVGDVVLDTTNKKEAEEILSGVIMRMTGDDAGELIDKITEAIGLGKMLPKSDSKD